MLSSSGDHLEGKRINERYRIKRVEKWTEHTVFCVAEDMADSRLYDLILLNSTLIKSDAELNKQLERKLRLKHKNIVELLASGSSCDGEAFIVTQKADKSTLSDLLGNGPMPLRQATELLMQILDALIYLQKSGEPCFLPFPHLICVDSFGIQMHSRLSILEFASDLLPVDTCTKDPASPIQKALYTAPECLQSGKVDQFSQIYSVACILYQMLCGKAPFESDDLVELESQQLCVNPQRLHEKKSDLYVDPAVEKVLIKALQKEPGKRQSSLAEFKSELQDALCAHKFWNTKTRKLTGIAASVLLLVAVFCFTTQSGIGFGSTKRDPVVQTESSDPELSAEPVVDPAGDPFAAIPKVPANAIDLGDLVLSSNQRKELAAGDYVCKHIHMTGDAKLSSNGSVRLWIEASNDGDHALVLQDSSSINAGKNLEDITIYDLDQSSIKMSGKSSLRATVLAPAALLEAGDNAEIHGSFTSNGQKLDQHARFINSSSDE